jgi:prepilin-type N-terminal cleavage/methylation domain-containing protein
MKIVANSTDRSKAAFTMVELMTVIAIIGILAGLFLTVIPTVTDAAKIRKTDIEMGEILSGIQAYESAYGHFPVSHAARLAAKPDFTYGGTLLTRSGQVTVGTQLADGSILQNDQIVAVLMDLTNYPGATISTINTNSQANPRKTAFLSPNLSGDTSSPGVGTDLVYRDPWGNPYVISLDLNGDGVCEDAFYKMPGISTNGINGLILQPDGKYAFDGPIMVWSAGPNKRVNGAMTAVQAENRDNVMSWR